MLSTLTLAAALTLAPAQSPAKFSLSNVRSTHGLIGPTRTGTKFLPGDIVYLGFDIDGVTTNKDGKVMYTMAVVVTEKKSDKIVRKFEATDRVDFAPLGGGKVPGVAFVALGVDMEPGEYTVKVTATDGGTKDVGKPSDSFTFGFEVLPPALGIIMVRATTDPQGSNPTHTTGFVGQFLWIQFAATGFKRDKEKKNNPDLLFEMTILDEKGKATLETPMTVAATALEEMYPICTARMNVPLTRAGKYTVRLKVTDNVAKQSATFDLPIQAVPVEK